MMEILIFCDCGRCLGELSSSVNKAGQLEMTIEVCEDCEEKNRTIGYEECEAENE
jgi:hypothetical protein